MGSATTSIGSSILKHREENGRRYHAYKAGKYFLPNDEEENNRLDLQHHLFCLTFGEKLYHAPLEETNLHNVLDAGTGTGIWAIDFADKHPEAKVLGIDLSPIQPSFLPPNLIFEVDDLEEPWTFTERFDFIYSRMMTGSLDFEPFFSKAFEFLTPRGYIEATDVVYPILCDDGTLRDDSALKKWSQLSLDASIKLGRPVNSATKYKSQLESAGFVDVVRKEFKWPMNWWPKDKHHKELGIWTYENFLESLFAGTIELFTKGLAWSRQEVDVFLVDVRKDIKNPKIHAYWNM